MTSNIFSKNDYEVMKRNQATEISLILAKVRNNIWLFGVPCWLLGIADRVVAVFADNHLIGVELLQLLATFVFFLGWLYLKPEQSFDGSSIRRLQSYQQDALPCVDKGYLHKAQARMSELQPQHMISQEYILPFPYLCQIYHLLNLKHLETIHNFSLSNLRVIKVSQVQPTTIGGTVKFQTVLESPLNALRIWRQPIVEAELTLHTPYTVELSIPVYDDKRIAVIFNALPTSDTEHSLLIDIYSNLKWPKPLLQILLHFASCLTLFEDLPYLHKLAQRNISRVFSLNRVSNHETMWLFRRFVDLYGSRLEPIQPAEVTA
jgi:hypothetical protein